MLREVLVRLSVVAFVCCLSVTAHAMADQKSHVSVPAGDLTAGLELLAKQSGAEFVYRADQLKGLLTRGVSGDLTPKEAVTQLLIGTPLQLRMDPSGAMLIAPARANTTSDNSSAAGTDQGQEGKRNSSSGFLVAQVDQANAGPQAVEEKEEKQPVLEEIVVTGTHIRGRAAPAGSNMVVLDSTYIDKSGYGTVQDLMNTLPQNFPGGPNDYNVSGGNPSSLTGPQNFNRGASVNLRGLGPDATLVLVDGLRQAPSGNNGAFVDVSSIPISAIQRIEVLTDGASAIYGSDSIGGVVNIILKRDYEGAETRLKVGTLDGDATETQASQLFGHHWEGGNILIGYQYADRRTLLATQRVYAANSDQRPNGGDDFSEIYSNPGNILDPNTGLPAYAIPRGQAGVGLTPSQLLGGVINEQNTAIGEELLPEEQTNNVFLALHQNLSDALELFANARYGTRQMTSVDPTITVLDVPATNPFFVTPYPGATDVFVAYSLVDDLKPHAIANTDTLDGSVGGVLKLGAWRVNATGFYSRDSMHYQNDILNQAALTAALSDSSPGTAFNPFGDGSHTNPTTLATLLTRKSRTITLDRHGGRHNRRRAVPLTSCRRRPGGSRSRFSPRKPE